MLIGLIAVITAVGAAAAAEAVADAVSNHKKHVQSLLPPPPRIQAEVKALHDSNLRTVEVCGKTRYYDRQSGKEIIVTDGHSVRVVS